MMRTKFDCPACRWSGFPSFDLRGNLLRAQCGNGECNYVDMAVGPADFQQVVAVVTDENGAKQTRTVDRADWDARNESSPPPSPPRAHAPVPQRLLASPQDIVGAARARLGELDLEIARLEGLKAERGQLRRMVAAAERAPKRSPSQPRIEDLTEALQLRLEN